MILLTVGTQFPFDRLVRVVDDWASSNGRTDVVAQVGESLYTPRQLRSFAFTSPSELRRLQEQCSVMISHAGMGSIFAALELGKPIIIMPRDHTRGEHRNAHQLGTAQRFSSRAGVHVAADEVQLGNTLRRLDALIAPETTLSSVAPPEFVDVLRRHLSNVFAGKLADQINAIVGGISTARVNRKELAQMMIADVQRGRSGALAAPRLVVASNGAVIAKYHSDAKFRALIDSADIVDPDGQPLILAARLLLREPLRERIATTDFINDAAAAAAEHGIRFYFLGARPGLAEAAARRLVSRFPGLQIVGTEHGYFEEAEVPAILARIRASRADVLWLGLGSPHQERFAVEHRDALSGLTWIRTCGGLFDHLGGDVPRAPGWMQTMGLEWLFRAILEPRRLGLRYLVTNPAAAYHLLTKTRN